MSFAPLDFANDAFMNARRTTAIWSEQSKHATAPTSPVPVRRLGNEQIRRKQACDSPSVVLAESDAREVDIEASLEQFFFSETFAEGLRLRNGPKAQGTGSRFALIALPMISSCRSFGDSSSSDWHHGCRNIEAPCSE